MQRLTTFLLLAGITSTAQAQTDCSLPHDINNNGSVDIEDFLSILGLFGDQDSDGDGLYDSQDNCIDLGACNFSDVDAEFCFYPDAIGDCNGNCPVDADGDGVCDVFSCGGPMSYQGYDYTTVLIGDQCWFAENLRSESYLNGDSIPSTFSNQEWQDASSGGVAVYNEDGSNLATYGRLYNLYAVQDERGLCPSGWHVSTDDEWIATEMALGMSPTEATDTSWRGTNQGTQMKSNYGWAEASTGEDGNGTNSSGFSALPGGYRTGNFSQVTFNGEWWTSSSNSAGAWKRMIISNRETIHRSFNQFKSHGLSIRCIQDSE